ncbi:DUF6130 family protein [Paenibacillus chartarius]|uniref:DUF6130 family protein n=1 Tax=Paenibacillus chartarius TaxID=747481 RepID=A0ABV6DEE2_9BACL
MNRKMMLSAAALVAAAVIGTACGKSESTGAPEAGGASPTKASSISTNDAKPTLTADLVQDGHSVTITYKVENMHISSEHYGHQAVPGEGHLHVYVDGVQKAGLKTDAPVRLENLPAGKHTIKLNLQNNDHTSLGVEKSWEIEVK